MWTFLHPFCYLFYLCTAHTFTRCRLHNAMATSTPTCRVRQYSHQLHRSLYTYHSVLRSLSAPDSSPEDPSEESLPPLEWLSKGSYWYGSTIATALPSAASDPELPPSNGENSQERLSSLSFELPRLST